MNIKRIAGTPYEGLFQRLKTNTDGELLVRFLKENLSEADEALRSQPELAIIHRLQGKALTIKAILDLLDAKK